MKLAIIFILALLLAQPAGAFNFEVGVYSGDGTDNRNISTSASFAIDSLLIKCNAAEHTYMRTSSIAGDLSDAIGAGGGLGANRIQSLGTGTFQIGSSTGVNTSGTNNCFYVAWGADANNDLAIGTYVGDGLDDRDIVISPAFSPGFVIILGEQDDGSRWRLSAMTGDAAIPFSLNGVLPNNIQAFNANGFQIGTSTTVNDGTGGTVDYYPLSLKNINGYAASGTYTATGSPTDGLEIAVGFQPDLVIVKSDTNAGVGIFRTSAMVGDFSCPITNVACGANFIESITATGFTIGTSNSVQAASVKYWWYAIKTPVYISKRTVSPVIFQ